MTESNGVAVVTGGARGIGLRVVEGLASTGLHVVAVDLDGDELGRIHGDATNVSVAVADVREEGVLADIARQATQEHGPMKVWVNSAGVFSVTPARDVEMDEWERQMSINARGTMLGCQSAADAMWNTGGSIINVASLGGIRPTALVSAYGAAKAAVVHLTRVLALEWGPRGIRVNSVNPGFIDTRMLSWMRDDPERRAEHLPRVPLGRLGTADDVLGAIAFLASDASSYITGSEIVVDGGLSLN